MAIARVMSQDLMIAAPHPVPGMPTLSATAEAGTGKEVGIWLGGVALLAVAAAVTANMFGTATYVGTTQRVAQGLEATTDGFTLFALFYAAAQAIERFLEPLSGIFELEKTKTEVDAKKTQAAEAQIAVSTAPANGTGAAQEALGQLATASAKLSSAKRIKATAFWLLATALGIWAAAALDLYLLKTIGASIKWEALDVFVTGLVIGSGTKPLHDLITLVQEKKEEKSGDK